MEQATSSLSSDILSNPSLQGAPALRPVLQGNSRFGLRVPTNLQAGRAQPPSRPSQPILAPSSNIEKNIHQRSFVTSFISKRPATNRLSDVISSHRQSNVVPPPSHRISAFEESQQNDGQQPYIGGQGSRHAETSAPSLRRPLSERPTHSSHFWQPEEHVQGDVISI